MQLTPKQAQLIKRTALVNIHLCDQRKIRSTEEFRAKYAPVGNKVLACVALIDYYMEGVRNDFEEAGRYKHADRRCINECLKLTASANGRTYSDLQRVETREESMPAEQQYVRVMDSRIESIEGSILLQGIERNINIVLALARLLKKYNTALTNKYCYPPAFRLYEIEKRLLRLGVKDYNLDFLIERTL